MNTKHPPTKKQVPNDAFCWFSFGNSIWIRKTGYSVRKIWFDDYKWLPYDAIPDPESILTKE